MAEWLMSVVGIVAAGVLLEIILPPGDTAKYAKGAYALIVVLVLASPIANVLSQFKTIEGDATAVVDDMPRRARPIVRSARMSTCPTARARPTETKTRSPRSSKNVSAARR